MQEDIHMTVGAKFFWDAINGIEDLMQKKVTKSNKELIKKMIEQFNYISRNGRIIPEEDIPQLKKKFYDISVRLIDSKRARHLK